ncbi:MAG: hypothetical protein ACKO5C_09420, partial [Ferruginibacter sp.]
RALRSLIPFSDIVFCPDTLTISDTLTLMQTWRGQYSFRFHLAGSRGIIYTNCIASTNIKHAHRG